MPDLNGLLNNARDEDSLRKAEQEAAIEYARMLVHDSINESTWNIFGINMGTPKTKINPFDFEDRSDYSLEGSVNFDDGKTASFTFEIKIGSKRVPEKIFFYRSDEGFSLV